jgi:biotin/methionine sulfoxide reductase
MFQDYRTDPEQHRLPTPSGKFEIYSERIAAFNYGDCPGHPAWFEPLEWLGDDARRYPLHLISSQPSTKLHSQYDHGAYSQGNKIAAANRFRCIPTMRWRAGSRPAISCECSMTAASVSPVCGSILA